MKKFLVLLLICSFALPLLAVETNPAASRDQALTELRNGNARFATGHPHIWNITSEKRELLAKGQHPMACVITCSDSRVSPEYLFDQSLGDIFVIRLAGNVVSPEAIGSVEYAVEHLHVPLVVVLGHSSCGAVGAALSDAVPGGSIGTLLSYIKPAIDAAKLKGFSGDELPGAVVAENARHGTEVLLHNSRIIDDAVNHGEVAVVSASYDLKNGKVTWQNLISTPVADAAPVAIAPASAPAPAKVAAAVKPATEPVAKTASTSTVKKTDHAKNAKSVKIASTEKTPAAEPVKISSTEKAATAEPAKPTIVNAIDKPAAAPAPAVEQVTPAPVTEKAPVTAPAPTTEVTPAPEKPATPAPEKVVTSETTTTVTPAAAPADPKPADKPATEAKPAPKKREISNYAKRH